MTYVMVCVCVLCQKGAGSDVCVCADYSDCRQPRVSQISHIRSFAFWPITLCIVYIFGRLMVECHMGILESLLHLRKAVYLDTIFHLSTT